VGSAMGACAAGRPPALYHVILALPVPAAGQVHHHLGPWRSGMEGSHFWDCNGGGCDSTAMHPFDITNYVYAPQYAPVVPSQHGGSVYGEQLWMTGAASDALSALLGPDQGCCGADKDGGGGCGQCVIIRNPSARHANWTAVVMKKSRCPPESAGCEAPSVHFDLAVPGYDNTNYSLSNVCGDKRRKQTYLTKDESGVCASLYKGPTVKNCTCAGLPVSTPEQQALKRGCELFSQWGWTRGDPALEFQRVACPERFTRLVGDAFGPFGVRPLRQAFASRFVVIAGGIVLVALFVGLFVRCFFNWQEKREAEARKQNRLAKRERRRLGSEGPSSSSSASSATSDSDTQ